jgi:hypothetical protein
MSIGSFVTYVSMLYLPWPLFSKEGNKRISPFEKGGLRGI